MAMLGMIALLLFPLAFGPYATTHGPVTVLRAMRDSLLLRLSIVLAAISLCRIRCCQSFAVRFEVVAAERTLLQNFTHQKSSILRC